MKALVNAAVAYLPAMLQNAGPVLIAAIWQGAFVAAFLGLALRVVNRTDASLRFALWSIGFIAVAGLPFLSLFPTSAAQSVLGSATATGPWIAPLLTVDSRWSIALGLLWVAASLYRAADLAVHTIRLHQLWRSAKPTHCIPVRLSGRKPIQICTTDSLDRPSVIGFLAPRILIPAWLLTRLTAGELDQIVLHETEHLRRCDDWTNLLQKLSLILFPLNPVLLWMERQLCLEREMACDEAVVRATRSPRSYAACLTSLAERGLEHSLDRAHRAALSLGSWQHRPELARRVHSLLRSRKVLGPWPARGLAAVLSCALLAGSVELSRAPQLVAFVPFRSGESAAVPTSLLKNIPTQAIPAAKALPQARMIEARYAVPARGLIRRAELRSVSGRLATQPTPALTQGLASKKIPLKASSAANDPAASSAWLVLTTWEEVATVAGQPMPKSDVEDSTTAPDSIAAPAQITVTRMVFRVIPAKFAAPPPTAIRTRDGWLVLQL